MSSNIKYNYNKRNDPEKVCSSKYYDIEEMYQIKIPHKNKSLSLLPVLLIKILMTFNIS